MTAANHTPLFLTLPGYEGLYFQGMGQNLHSEDFAFESLNYNDKNDRGGPAAQ